MDAEPRILVLLAAFNGTEWLDDQLSSILGQTGVQVSVLISVDLSTDGTEDLVDLWATRDHRVTALPHGAVFGGAAKNFYRLIRTADIGGNSHVALADQDDVWLPHKLRRACSRLEEEAADGYSSNVFTWDGFDEARLLDKAQPLRRWDHLFSSAGPGCTYVFPASTLRRIQIWMNSGVAVDAAEYHDWLLYAWLREGGMRWTIDAQATMLYRQHAANQLGANVGLSSALRRWRSAREHWYAEQAHLIATLVGAKYSPINDLTGPAKSRLRALPRVRDMRRSPRDTVALAAMAAFGVLGRRDC